MHIDCRSLLQKAIRRGFEHIVATVFAHLWEVDRTWLRLRIPVFLYEEAWPLAARCGGKTDFERSLAIVLAVTRSQKNKDAAGLGALVFELSKGGGVDRAIEIAATDDAEHAFRMILHGIQDPDDYFSWAIATARSESALLLVQNASADYRRIGWPWDKAMALAAAYLAVTSDVTPLEIVENPVDTFPFWIALDKHTDAGKIALREVAAALDLRVRQLSWTSFYFGSARVNSLKSSRWFRIEARHRLSRMNSTLEECSLLWKRAAPALESALHAKATVLKEHFAHLEQAAFQPSLLHSLEDK